MDFYQFIQLVFVKVALNLRSEASQSYLNYLWWVLEPTLFVAVFYLVFGVLLDRGGPDFVVFLVCGKIPFLWYSRTVTNCSGSILAGKGLIGQIYIPKEFFPIVVFLQDATKQCVVFLFLLGFLVFNGTGISWYWLYLPLVAACQALFVLSSGLVVASLVPVVPDLRYVINTGVMLLMFGSGIFYSYKEVVDPKYQEIFLSNPMAALIKSYRQILIDGAVPDFERLFWISIICGAISTLAIYVLRKYHGQYSRLALQ